MVKHLEMEFGSKNKIVWIMGGMASGKSTLRRALCYCLGGEKRIDDELHITEYGDDVVCIGACKTGIEDNFRCDGLDSSFGKLKKDGALSVTEHCIKNYKVTILEGSQTSGKWVEPNL